VRRISSYGLPRNLRHKTVPELQALRAAGLPNCARAGSAGCRSSPNFKFTISSMLSPFKNLLNQFFMPDNGQASIDDARSLQLATAVLLVEVMRSDTAVSAEERSATLAALRTQFALSDDELARLLAQAEDTAKSANDYFRFTSAMNEQFTQAEKIQVVEHMWQVAFADGHLDANENHLISKIAGLLHVTHGEYIAAKLHAREAAQRRS
jgi:uncharacterized tellurite resistance protein B-like protein